MVCVCKNINNRLSLFLLCFALFASCGQAACVEPLLAYLGSFTAQPGAHQPRVVTLLLQLAMARGSVPALLDGALRMLKAARAAERSAAAAQRSRGGDDEKSDVDGGAAALIDAQLGAAELAAAGSVRALLAFKPEVTGANDAADAGKTAHVEVVATHGAWHLCAGVVCRPALSSLVCVSPSLFFVAPQSRRHCRLRANARVPR